MCEAFLSLQITQMRLEGSQGGDPSHPPPQSRSTKPRSGRPMQLQPFAAAPALFGCSLNVHIPFADLSIARGELETARGFPTAIRLYRTAHRLSELSSIWAGRRAIIFFFLLHYNVKELNRRIMYKLQ